MVNEAGKTIRVALDPGGHVAAIAAAGRGHPFRVDVGKAFQQIVRGFQDVLQRPVAPLVEDALGEFLAQAGRAVTVDPGDNVAGRGKHVGVPAIAPAVAVHAVRAAVHQLDERVGLLRVVAGGQHEPAVDFLARGAVEPVALHLAEIELGHELIVEMSELPRRAGFRIEGKELVRPARRVVQENNASAAGGEAGRGALPVDCGQAGAVGVELEDRHHSLVLNVGPQGFPVGGKFHRVYGVIKRAGQRRVFARGQIVPPEFREFPVAVGCLQPGENQ